MSFDFLFADFLEDGAALTAELPARSQTSHASPTAEWVPVSFAPVVVADSTSSRGSSAGSNSSTSSSSSSSSSSATTVVVDESVASTTGQLSAAMQAVHDTATQKLRTLQSAATVCQFALCDEFLESLQSGTYSRDTKVFICHTYARASFAKACTYALASVNKAKSHALLAAKAAAEADAAVSSENSGGHARKRHRAARACEACRIGKRRCERERGAATCNYCAARGMDCVWNDINGDDHDGDGDGDDDDNVVDAASRVVLPVARSAPGVLSDALLEEMGLSDDVGSYATIKMPSGVAQALLLPIRSAAVLARRGMSIDGPTVVNMNDEFLALTGLSRSELQFSPVGVALAPQSRGAIINMLGIMRRFMLLPSDRHVVKTPMQTAIFIHGTWFPGELTLTIVMRNRLPALVHVAVDRVLTDQPPIEPPLSTARVAQGGIPPDLLEPFLKHRQFVLNLLNTLKSK